MPLKFKRQQHTWTATPFKELVLEQPELPDLEPLPGPVDLDFSNFDIDDNCYVYHTTGGRSNVISKFKTELSLKTIEPPEPAMQEPKGV